MRFFSFLLAFSTFSSLFAQPCEIYNLSVQTGNCTSISTYQLTLDFQVQNPSNQSFDLWANNTQLIGTFQLSQLPITVPNFPYNGGNNDVLKVCINDNPNCCKIAEFPVPPCINNPQPCEIYNLSVQTGNCTSISTYQLTLDFQVQNPSNQSFDLWANNSQLIGTFQLSQLPITIPNFPYNGGNNDVLKVCINDNPNCCKIAEFPVPPCINNPQPCEIYNLSVQTGNCTSISTYQLTLDFQVQNPSNQSFDLWANNSQLIGTFQLSQLPITIPNFPYNGGNNDVLKVCINDNPNCCKIAEFPVPPCINNPQPCEIYNLSVQTGECTSNSTYQLTLDFQVQNPSNQSFDLWANNSQLIGTFQLSQLPITIPNFPYNGGNNDVLKVCINDNPNCCKIAEFPVPPCINNPQPCEIYNLSVQTGNCTSISTYQLTLDFQVQNPSNQSFDLWANNTQLIGTFQLSQLPVTVPNFPYNGGNNDVLKVCINDNPNCCKIAEFPVPPCLTYPCIINHLEVEAAPCLNGTFLALVKFNVENNTSDSFIVLVNNTLYQKYSYSTPQPILIGPFAGDGTTNYLFTVKDEEVPFCTTTNELGAINCPEIETLQKGQSLVIAPNPVRGWAAIQAKTGKTNVYGAGVLSIVDQDGKTVQSEKIAQVALFHLDTANLPVGKYTVSLWVEDDVFRGSFIKL